MFLDPLYVARSHGMMVKCRCCGNGDVPEHEAVHAACGAEFDRRKAAELCMFCGTKLADSDIVKNTLGHEACYSPDIFTGYPGQ